MAAMVIPAKPADAGHARRLPYSLTIGRAHQPTPRMGSSNEREIHMTRLNILKLNKLRHMPKLMLALGVVALALVASGGATAQRADAAEPLYEVELEFTSIKFTSIDDCSAFELSYCDYAETYMTMRGQTQSGGSYDGLPYRNLGKWGVRGPSGCSATGHNWFTKSGACLASVSPFDGTRFFADTPLCPAVNSTGCPSSFYKNSNKIYLKVRGGESIYAALYAKDYDEVSADDTICHVSQWHGPFPTAQLATLNWSPPSMASSNADGGCLVNIRLKTIRQLLEAL
jgi:hypothetical protein